MGKHLFHEVTSSCAEVVTRCATGISFSYIQLPMSKVYLQSALPLFVQLVLLYQSRNTVVGQLKKVLQQKLYTKRTNSRKVKVILIINFG